MSRTQKGKKGCGFEFWKSRYSPHGDGPGRFIKDVTHKRERLKAKINLNKGTETNPKY